MSTSCSFCLLCKLNIGSFPIVDQGKTFCCKGCHTVYQILDAQNKVDEYENSHVFQQALKYGLISNKELLNTPSLSKDTQYTKLIFEIEGMWCSTCKDLVEILLNKVKGVKSVFVDYTTDLCTLEYAPMYLSKEFIFEKIESFGYKVLLLESSTYQEGKRKDLQMYLRLAIASFASLNIMMLSYPIYEDYLGITTHGYNYLFAWISLVLSLPIIFYSMKPIWNKFLLSIKCFKFTMESLIIIGVSSSFLLSFYQLLKGSDQVYFDSLSMIVVFVLWGKAIESKAKKGTKDRLFQLHKQIPKKARIKDEKGNISFKPLKEVKRGDHLICLTGEKIVLDGVVVEGQGSVDESLLTGEAIPIFKTKDSSLIGSSFLKSGYLVYEVSSLFEDTVFAKVCDLLQEDLTKNSSRTPIVDLITKLFVPTVLIISLMTAVCVYFSKGIEDSFLRFLAVLLISCPCALAISIPLVESLLILKLSEMGILVRNKEALKDFCDVDTLIFDKTGTLTEGKFRLLTKIEIDIEEQKALKGLALSSNHPVSIALQEITDLEPLHFDEVQEVIGRGITGRLGKDKYILGSINFLDELHIDTKKITGEATVYFVKNNQILQELFLDDALRENIKEDISRISIPQKIILSGDRRIKVEEVAKYLSIDTFQALCSPFDKRNYVELLKKNKKKVAMIGDGINDSLSLSLSDVSISLMSGSELSCHVSSIILTNNTLANLEKMRLLCIKATKLIKQNLFWAFFYNIVGVFLAVWGFFPPIIAAFAMVLSSLVVILNSKRL